MGAKAEFAGGEHWGKQRAGHRQGSEGKTNGAGHSSSDRPEMPGAGVYSAVAAGDSSGATVTRSGH